MVRVEFDTIEEAQKWYSKHEIVEFLDEKQVLVGVELIFRERY